MTDALVAFGRLAGALAAIVACCVVIGRLPPIRWLWRRNISEPINGWLERLVSRVVNEELDRRPLTNGWGGHTIQKIAEAVEADFEPPHPRDDR